jgi:hypothetical protein
MDESTPSKSTQAVSKPYLEQVPGASGSQTRKLISTAAEQLAANDEANEKDFDYAFVLGYN